MNVKILSLCLMIFATLLFSGCTKTIYVDRPVEVKVPVKCIVPDVVCDVDRDTYTEVIRGLYQCVAEYKEAVKVCK